MTILCTTAMKIINAPFIGTGFTDLIRIECAILQLFVRYKIFIAHEHDNERCTEKICKTSSQHSLWVFKDVSVPTFIDEKSQMS